MSTHLDTVIAVMQSVSKNLIGDLEDIPDYNQIPALLRSFKEENGHLYNWPALFISKYWGSVHKRPLVYRIA